jgi:hypothetical protein
MAAGDFKRLFFFFKRNTGDDAQRVLKNPAGYFSCLYYAAKFLDIEGLAKQVFIEKERKAHTRTKARALDGVATGTTNVAESKIVIASNPRGSRSIILVTGKPTSAVNATAGKPVNFHQLTFRFPSWADTRTIGEALGEIIPDTKITKDGKPSSTEIFPWFRIKGGRQYPIIQAAAAEQSTAVIVPETITEVNQLAQQLEDSDALPSAG